jgi:hypothetical protein
LRKGRSRGTGRNGAGRVQEAGGKEKKWNGQERELKRKGKLGREM